MCTTLFSIDVQYSMLTAGNGMVLQRDINSSIWGYGQITTESVSKYSVRVHTLEQATWSGVPDHKNWDQATWSVPDHKKFDIITIKTISFQPFSADFSLLCLNRRKIRNFKTGRIFKNVNSLHFVYGLLFYALK